MHPTPAYSIFDLETASADSDRYNPVLQYAHVDFDRGFEPLDVFEAQAHWGGHYASPQAASVNGIGPSAAQGSPLELAQRCALKMQSGMLSHEAGTVKRMMGYNNCRFDGMVLRRFLFANGQDPHMAVGGASAGSALDVFRLVALANATRSDVLEFSLNAKGKRSLKLSDVAQANGVDASGAHDALADVIMTGKLARRVAREDPALWRFFLEASEMSVVRTWHERRQPMINIVNGMHVVPVLPVAPHPRRPTAFVGYKLDAPKRLEKFLALSDDELAGFFGMDPANRPKGFQSATAGNVPIRVFNQNGLYLPDLSELHNPDKRGEAVTSLRLLREVETAQPGAAARKLLLAYRDAAPRTEPPGVENALFSMRLTSDDHSLRRRIVRDVLRSPAELRLGAAAHHFSGDRDAHLQLLALWKYDALVMPKVMQGDVEGAMRTLQEAASQSPQADADAPGHLSGAHEVALYMDAHQTRFLDPDLGWFSCRDRSEEDMRRVMLQTPEAYYEKLDVLQAVDAYNRSLQDFNSLTLQALMAMEQRDGLVTQAVQEYMDAADAPLRSWDIVCDEEAGMSL